MATRLYFSEVVTPAVAPAFGTGWARTAQAARRALQWGKAPGTTDPLTAVNITDWTAQNQTVLARQFVSAPLAAQTIAGTAKCYVRVSESAANDNLSIQARVAVVSNDGATQRGELFALGAVGNTLEWNASSTVFQNRAFYAANAVASVAAQDGDRLVVELGAVDALGLTISAFLAFGGTSAGTDVGEDATNTTGVGWFELSQTLAFRWSDVSEPFTGTVLDTRTWLKADQGTSATTWNDKLIQTPQASAAGTVLAQTISNPFFDLTGGSLAVQVPQVVAADANALGAYVALDDATSVNRVTWLYNNGNLIAQKRVANVETSVATLVYSATDHQWWRIRESGGTTFWDTAPDGLTWTNRFSAANPIAVTLLRPYFAAGTLASVASPGAAWVDSLNVTPAAPGGAALLLTRALRGVGL